MMKTCRMLGQRLTKKRPLWHSLKGLTMSTRSAAQICS